MEKLSSQSLAGQAREAIRKAIFEGVIRPDERFTIERIASELGISRTPVREALKSLETEGIVSILPNKGLVVRQFDRDELAQRYSLRALLESYAGEFACQRQTPQLVKELEANLEEMKQRVESLDQGEYDLEQSRRLIELNVQFHQFILRESGQTLVLKVLESLQMPVAYRLYQWRLPERRQAIISHHQQIIDAFRANDAAEVSKVLREHIEEVREFLLNTEKN